jgi:hypothetical protein
MYLTNETFDLCYILSLNLNVDIHLFCNVDDLGANLLNFLQFLLTLREVMLFGDDILYN